MIFRNPYVSARLPMILLVNSFLEHYFFVVVQKTPIPTQPGGLPNPRRARGKSAWQDTRALAAWEHMVSEATYSE